MTELLLGFGAPSPYGSTATTTPPEIRVGPEGTLPEMWLAFTSMPLAPRSAIPIPEKFLPKYWSPHERVLSATVLPETSKPPTGSALKASKNMPAQLSCIWFPVKEPPWEPSTKMPHAPPEIWLPTILALLDCFFGPNT